MKVLKNLLLVLFLSLFLVGCKSTEKFMVTFKSGDTVIVSEEVKKGGNATAPADPVKEGFTFTGWDKAFTNVEENLTVNAGFTVKKFQVQFMVDNMPYGTPIEVDYGGDTLLPSAPTKTGFVFLAWDKDANNVIENLIVNATFKVASYSVIFRVDGVQVGETQTVDHGEAAIAPSDPEKIGHTFIGWDKEFDSVESALIISAQFEALTYTVTFYSDENTVIGDSQTIAYGQAAIAPTAPERVGFTFDGWDKEFNNITADLNITAEFIVAMFTVKFMVDGVQFGPEQIIEYNGGLIVPENPTKTGYLFVSWDTVFEPITADLTINAEFSIITYEIKYFDGVSELSHTPATYTIEDAIEYNEYEVAGFLFLGWFKTVSLDIETTGITVGSIGEVKVYGKWLDESKTYDVDFSLNGGTWTWSNGVVDPVAGINEISNLPEIFMQDFYTYLKDNNLLEASTVHSTLRKTLWADFSVLGGDPFAIYNKTSTNVASTPDGYSQFFYTAIADASATGGFLGTEPYKAKYANLCALISYLFPIRYASSNINAENGKALFGFLIDGYFYGTQDPRTGDFLALRSVIPNTNLKYFITEGVLISAAVEYPVFKYIQGLSYRLPMPSRVGFSFLGWYTDASFSGEEVSVIEIGIAPSSMYYAKWLVL